jgi:MFS family permease
LAAGLIVYGLAGGAGLVIRDYTILLVSRVVLGLGVAGVYTGVTVSILRVYSGSAQQRMMGFRGAANSFGGVIWPLVGGAVGSIAWYLPFGIYLLGVPLGLVAFFILPHLPGTKEEPSKAQKIVGRRFNIQLILPYLSMLIANMLLYGIVVFFPQRLGQLGIHSTFIVSLFLAVSSLSSALTAAQYGWISNRLAIPARAIVSFLVWILAFALAGLASTWPLLMLAAALFGVGQGIVFPTALLWVDSLVEKRYQASASSLVAVSGFVGQFISPLILGPVAQAWSFSHMFWGAAAIPVIGLAATLALGAGWEPKKPAE